ncbi:MAG: SIMPL domain-containing protein [Hyphomonadaceae bacterium]|nr:SIMPL domain-containing protein [Hyphomonadaceae bacterium]
MFSRQLSFRPWTRGFFALALVALAVGTLGACERRETLLTVHASATTRTAPDLAIVTLGVVARGATARAAQNAQNERMQAVMAAVQAAGVEEGGVQTVGFSLDPIYAYPRNAAPRITGYQSTNVISIRVSNLDAISGLIDATVADGANTLQGIQFTYANEEASRETARAQAVEVARARADAYATAAGMKVARVVSITEPGAFAPSPTSPYEYAARDVASEQAMSNAIAPGQLDNPASVTIVFELR